MTLAKNTFSFKFVAALTARNAEQFSKDTETAINNATAGYAALDAAMSKPEFKEVASALIKGARIAVNVQDKQAFIAVKVLVKIVKMLEAIGQGRSAELDPYTRTIAANLCKLNGISNKSALVSLSRSIAYDELDQVATLTARYNCSAGTAGTQASSTRMGLKYLQVCEVSKGKQGDVMTLSDNDRARAFVALFSDAAIETALTAE